MPPYIDAHHHLWQYTDSEFSWIVDEMAHLRRDFTPEDLEPLRRAAGIDGTVVVQARQTIRETNWLLETAGTHPWIRGVVGWAPIASDSFPSALDQLRGHARLKGLRHVIQDEPNDNFILGEAFNRGISRLRDTGLVYDILIHDRHLPRTIRFVDHHPQQIFVLDHMAKPCIRHGKLEPWATHMRELAQRSNVSCKVSGMVTEADLKHWKPEDLEPFWEVALETFGPGRILAGSDWPVCEVASTYGRWFELIRRWVSPLSSTEQDAILGGNAINIYKLAL